MSSTDINVIDVRTSDFERWADYAEAKTEFSKAIDKGSVSAMNNLANVYSTLKRYDAASAQYQKVLKINPKSHVALYNISQIAYTGKNFELAKEYLTDAYAINADIETTNLLALTYMELNDYHNAKVLLNKLNNEIPNNTGILTTLAKAEMLDNNADMAKNYLEQVLAIFPESIEAQELMSGLK